MPLYRIESGSIFVAVNLSTIFIYGNEIKQGEKTILQCAKTTIGNYDVPYIPYSSVKGVFKASHRNIFFRYVVAKYFEIEAEGLTVDDIIERVIKKLREKQKSEQEILKYGKVLAILDLRPPFVGKLPLEIAEFVKEHPYYSTFGTGLGYAGKSKISFTDALPVYSNVEILTNPVIRILYDYYEELRKVFPNELPTPPMYRQDACFRLRTFLRYPIETSKEVKDLLDKVAIEMGLKERETPITKPVLWDLELYTIIATPFISCIRQTQSILTKENIGALILAFSNLNHLGKGKNQWIFVMQLKLFEHDSGNKYIIAMLNNPIKGELISKCIKITKKGNEEEIEENPNIINDFVNAYKNYLKPEEFEKHFEKFKELKKE